MGTYVVMYPRNVNDTAPEPQNDGDPQREGDADAAAVAADPPAADAAPHVRAAPGGRLAGGPGAGAVIDGVAIPAAAVPAVEEAMRRDAELDRHLAALEVAGRDRRFKRRRLPFDRVEDVSIGRWTYSRLCCGPDALSSALELGATMVDKDGKSLDKQQPGSGPRRDVSGSHLPKDQCDAWTPMRMHFGSIEAICDLACTIGGARKEETTQRFDETPGAYIDRLLLLAFNPERAVQAFAGMIHDARPEFSMDSIVESERAFMNLDPAPGVPIRGLPNDPDNVFRLVRRLANPCVLALRQWPRLVAPVDLRHPAVMNLFREQRENNPDFSDERGNPTEVFRRHVQDHYGWCAETLDSHICEETFATICDQMDDARATMPLHRLSEHVHQAIENVASTFGSSTLSEGLQECRDLLRQARSKKGQTFANLSPGVVNLTPHHTRAGSILFLLSAALRAGPKLAANYHLVMIIWTGMRVAGLTFCGTQNQLILVTGLPGAGKTFIMTKILGLMIPPEMTERISYSTALEATGECNMRGKIITRDEVKAEHVGFAIRDNQNIRAAILAKASGNGDFQPHDATKLQQDIITAQAVRVRALNWQQGTGRRDLLRVGSIMSTQEFAVSNIWAGMQTDACARRSIATGGLTPPTGGISGTHDPCAQRTTSDPLDMRTGTRSDTISKSLTVLLRKTLGGMRLIEELLKVLASCHIIQFDVVTEPAFMAYNIASNTTECMRHEVPRDRFLCCLGAGIPIRCASLGASITRPDPARQLDPIHDAYRYHAVLCYATREGTAESLDVMTDPKTDQICIPGMSMIIDMLVRRLKKVTYSGSKFKPESELRTPDGIVNGDHYFYLRDVFFLPHGTRQLRDDDAATHLATSANATEHSWGVPEEEALGSFRALLCHFPRRMQTSFCNADGSSSGHEPMLITHGANLMIHRDIFQFWRMRERTIARAFHPSKELTVRYAACYRDAPIHKNKIDEMTREEWTRQIAPTMYEQRMDQQRVRRWMADFDRKLRASSSEFAAWSQVAKVAVDDAAANHVWVTTITGWVYSDGAIPTYTEDSLRDELSELMEVIAARMRAAGQNGPTPLERSAVADYFRALDWADLTQHLNRMVHVARAYDKAMSDPEGWYSSQKLPNPLCRDPEDVEKLHRMGLMRRRDIAAATKDDSYVRVTPYSFERASAVHLMGMLDLASADTAKTFFTRDEIPHLGDYYPRRMEFEAEELEMFRAANELSDTVEQLSVLTISCIATRRRVFEAEQAQEDTTAIVAEDTRQRAACAAMRLKFARDVCTFVIRYARHLTHARDLRRLHYAEIPFSALVPAADADAEAVPDHVPPPVPPEEGADRMDDDDDGDPGMLAMRVEADIVEPEAEVAAAAAAAGPAPAAVMEDIWTGLKYETVLLHCRYMQLMDSVKDGDPVYEAETKEGSVTMNTEEALVTVARLAYVVAVHMLYMHEGAKLPEFRAADAPLIDTPELVKRVCDLLPIYSARIRNAVKTPIHEPRDGSREAKAELDAHQVARLYGYALLNVAEFREPVPILADGNMLNPWAVNQRAVINRFVERRIALLQASETFWVTQLAAAVPAAFGIDDRYTVASLKEEASTCRTRILAVNDPVLDARGAFLLELYEYRRDRKYVEANAFIKHTREACRMAVPTTTHEDCEMTNVPLMYHYPSITELPMFRRIIGADPVTSLESLPAIHYTDAHLRLMMAILQQSPERAALAQEIGFDVTVDESPKHIEPLPERAAYGTNPNPVVPAAAAPANAPAAAAVQQQRPPQQQQQQGAIMRGRPPSVAPVPGGGPSRRAAGPHHGNDRHKRPRTAHDDEHSEGGFQAVEQYEY